MIVACLIIAAYDRRRRRGIVSAILLAQLIAGVGYHAGKGLIGRYRPYAAVARAEDSSTLTTADTWIGWRPGNDAFETRSFPSGHSAAAFAFAGVLAWFYPRLGWLWWTLAAGCAASRYVEMFHWPSDCVAGGVLGYASARVALRVCRRGPQSAEAEEGRGVAAGR
jgi:membrane-associated phospholipid phosphatase